MDELTEIILAGNIRYFCHDAEDMYFVLKENGRLTIKCFPHGFKEVIRRIQSTLKFRFHFPSEENFLQSRHLHTLTERGITIENITENTEKFYDGFIDNILFKRFPDIALDRYLDCMKWGSGASDWTGEHNILVSRFVAEPGLLNINSPTACFQEVRFFNPLGQSIDRYYLFESFLNSGQEPKVLQGPNLFQSDIIYKGKNGYYFVEAKVCSINSSNTSSKRMKDKLSLAAYFLANNEEIQFTLVGVMYIRNGPCGKLRCRHFSFDRQTNRIKEEYYHVQAYCIDLLKKGDS